MSWFTRVGALAAAVMVAALIVSRRRGEVWHTLDGRGSDTGP